MTKWMLTAVALLAVAACDTGVVLATRGREVRIGPGADVPTRLTAPATTCVHVS